MKRLFSCFLFFIFLASSSAAFGQELIGRCKGKIVKAGVSKQFLLNNCGEPDHSENYNRGGRSGSAAMETLYYYVSRTAYIVTIRNNKVVKITKEAR
ncbi:DUF2845 domain-containing protein [Thermodesulfobacteriota bacterium]